MSWSLLILANGRRAQAQVYLTAPYGPGGTWNLYEHRGFLGWERFPDAGQPLTWLKAHQDAISRFEPFSGANVQGHLVAFSGPTAQLENSVVDLLTGIGPYSRAWIGLTDNETFGGGEAGSNGMAGFGNPPGDGIGWKWTSGEVFDFANWAPGSPSEADFASRNGGGPWFAGSSSSALPYIIEYETRSPVALSLPPRPLPPLLPGPPPRAGAFAIREVANNGPIEERLGNQGFIGSAIQSLRNIGPDAIVRDYYTPVIDFQAEFGPFPSTTGPSRPFEVLQRGEVSADQLDEFAMVAHGQILIPEGQGGDWTFAVDSDDGFELYIPGADFAPRLDTVETQYGSMLFTGTRAASGLPDSLGHVSLRPGVHDIELVYYENQTHASVELYAAPGRKSSFDNTFALIGAPAQNVLGRTPIVSEQFRFTNIHRIPNDPVGPTSSEHINTLAEAKDLIAAPDENDTLANFRSSTVNFDNINPIRDDTDHGRYARDEMTAGLGNDFASIARNTLSITDAGTYTFGFAVLDGGELTIDGAQFSELFGEGVITGGGQSLTLDRSLADGVAFAAVDLLPGHYSLEFVTYNRDGEMSAELFVAPGRVDFFDTGAFALLGPTSSTINYNRPAGLQLVPEPATLWSALIGAFISIVVASIRFGALRIFRAGRARP